MIIQKLSIEDVEKHRDSIYEMLQIDFNSTYGKFAKEEYVHNKIDTISKYISDESAIIYVAIEEQKMLGMIWSYPLQTPFGAVLHIAYISIYESVRNKGIGTTLIKMIEREAELRGYNKIELIVGANNSVARNFYEKNGYKEDRLYLIKEL